MHKRSFWADVQCTAIDFKVFALATLYRESVASFFTRSNPLAVHNLLPACLRDKIPSYVEAFVSKGSKFVPDRRKAHVRDVADAIPRFIRQFSIHVCLEGTSCNRARPRISLPSTWEPPRHADGDTLMLNSLDEFKQVVPVSNISFYDRKAIAWLKSNANQVLVLDGDKGLGDVLVSTTWTDAQASKLLREACVEVTRDSFVQGTRNAIDTLYAMKSRLSLFQTFPAKEWTYILSRESSSKAGTFRLRPKLHKNPPSARPVFNQNNTALHGLSKFLCVYYAPIQDSCDYVVRSTDEVIKRLLSERTQAWLRTARNPIVFSFDVVNLYPSIDHVDLKAKLKQSCQSFYPGLKGIALADMTALLISHQYTMYKERYYRVHQGLATGVHPALSMANVYLNGMDQLVMSEVGERLGLYCRYADDILGLAESEDLDRIADVVNSWNANIQVELGASGSCVPYLDISVNLSGGKISFSLFRKPQNLYLYLPRTSCHPEPVFRSVCSGEGTRLARRCQQQHVLSRELAFTCQKLISRGYSYSLIQSAFNRSRARSHPVSQVSAAREVKNLYLKQVFSFSVHRPSIRKCLDSAKTILAEHGAKPELVFTVQPNIFRILYKSNWLLR